jgi:hypothetical protein
MLTLLKQARAFGLGIVLATQNPMDLDYKGLSNMGTWFLGRLQTQRDKDRVLDGLEGASMQQGTAFDRRAMEKALSSLGNRVFLMNNVHDDGPTVFQTRWALSFLRGPLSRDQISTLMAPKRLAAPMRSIANSSSSSGLAASSGARPIVRAEVAERFLEATVIPATKSKVLYRPAILAQTSLHFVKSTGGVDYWKDVQLLSMVNEPLPDDVWEESKQIGDDGIQLRSQPDDAYGFSELPAEMSSAKNFAAWEKTLKEYLFRHLQCTVYTSKALKRGTPPGLSEADARIELAQAAKEARDAAVDKLQVKYADKLKSLQTRLQAAEQKVAKQKEEAKSKQMEGFLNIGTSILGALLGNKLTSKTNVAKAATAVKSFGKVTSKQGDVMRAEETLEELISAKNELETQAKEEIEALAVQYSPENLALEAVDIPLRKSDTKVKLIALAWVPWQVNPNGIASPLIDLD